MLTLLSIIYYSGSTLHFTLSRYLKNIYKQLQPQDDENKGKKALQKSILSKGIIIVNCYIVLFQVPGTIPVTLPIHLVFK